MKRVVDLQRHAGDPLLAGQFSKLFELRSRSGHGCRGRTVIGGNVDVGGLCRIDQLGNRLSIARQH